MPSLRLETRTGGVAGTDSRISGPWEGSVERFSGGRFGGGGFGVGKTGVGVGVEEREQGSLDAVDEVGGDLEKGGILVESSIEVGSRRAASLL